MNGKVIDHGTLCATCLLVRALAMTDNVEKNRLIAAALKHVEKMRDEVIADPQVINSKCGYMARMRVSEHPCECPQLCGRRVD